MRHDSESEVVAINYWKEVRKELDDIFFGMWNILLLIHNSVDFKELVEIFNRLPYSKKITYISLTKTCSSIYPFFREPYFKKLAKIFIVDCVSLMLFEKKQRTKNCAFVYPPANLNDMTKLIDKCLQKINPDLIILDSLSQFIDFSSISDSRGLLNFFYYLRSRTSDKSCKFILLYDDTYSRKVLKICQ